jgi:Phage tail tube protein
MTTQTAPTGRFSTLALAAQSAFDTAATTDYTSTYYYSESLAEREGLEADPLLGVNPNNQRDQVAPAPALSEHGGDLELPVCWNNVGLWLRQVLGAPATTGSADKTHVFSSGLLQLPTNTIQINKAAADFRQHVGFVPTSMKWQFEDRAGFQRLRLQGIGRGENLLTATAAGTPATMALDQVPATAALMRINGVNAGFVKQGEFEYKTGAAIERYVENSARAGAVVLDKEAEAMGEFRLRYTGSTAMDALAINKTVVPIEIEFQKTATRSILIAFPAVRFERPSTPITGPGGVESTVRFRAHQSASGPMMVITLKNQIASY